MLIAAFRNPRDKRSLNGSGKRREERNLQTIAEGRRLLKVLDEGVR